MLAALACAGLRELQAVAEALQGRYGEPVGVHVMNDAQLTLTFAGERYAKLAAAERERVAREAAGFAYARYPGRDQLETISVGFAGAQGAAAFTWPAAEVRGAAAASPGGP